MAAEVKVELDMSFNEFEELCDRLNYDDGIGSALKHMLSHVREAVYSNDSFEFSKKNVRIIVPRR